jgi:hypothetical protein
MHRYDVAQLNEEQIRKLNEYQDELSEQLGKDIILIAYNDGVTK